MNSSFFHQTDKHPNRRRIKRNDVLSIVKRFKLVVLLFAASLFFACQPTTDNSIPDYLIGMWVTSAPKYKSSYITFSTYYIMFGNVQENHVLMYSIKSIKKVNLNKDDLFTIIYIDDIERKDKENTFSFYHTPVIKSPVKNGRADISQMTSGVLRLKNKKNIEWKKLKELK